jgi:BolA protein
MSRKDRIEQNLADALELIHLEVLDESGNHSVPQGAQSHFKVVAVAESFAQQSRIARHRQINELLQAEFTDGMHALAVHAYSPQEWTARFGNAPLSPPCANAEKT